LQPLKIEAHTASNRPRQHSLASAGYILKQNMPLAQHCRQQKLDLLVFADNHRFDILDHALGKLCDPACWYV
jgi:hypothetical protein